MASINMQGRSYALASSFKLGPTAARTAAAAIMLNPYLRTAATVAGWLSLAGLAYDQASGLWTRPDPSATPSSGIEYSTNGQTWHSSAQAACSAGAVYYVSLSEDRRGGTATVDSSGRCNYFYERNHAYYVGGQDWRPASYIGTKPSTRSSSCPSGWYVTPAGCTQSPPPKTVTQEEFADELTKHPMPADVPRHIPTPLPVEQPNIQPTFIPTGDPVTNPKFNPSEAPSPSNPPKIQPGVDVKPAPAPGSPWQVDVTPVNRPITDPTATPDREPVPIPDPGGSGTGNPPGENKPQETPGLCDLYPTILACLEVKHEVDDTKLPTKEIEFEFNPIPGFQGAKVCPSFPNIGNMLGGRQISWQPFCDSLEKVSHLLLAIAWASAAFILLGYGRGD